MKYLLLIFLSFSAFSKSISTDEILRKVDLLYRSNTSFARMKMEISTPHWQRTMEMDIWSYKLSKTFVRVVSPRKDKGVATLRVDNDMWNYLPKVDKVMKIPPSMRMGSWMGSDFTNDDLVKESSYVDDYNSKLLEEKNGNYFIELSPKASSVSLWDKIIFEVEKKRLLPIQQLFYDERGELTRTINFKNVKSLGGKTIPVTMELIPNKKEGNKTVVHYVRAEFDIKLDDSIFTRQNLQRK